MFEQTYIIAALSLLFSLISFFNTSSIATAFLANNIHRQTFPYSKRRAFTDASSTFHATPSSSTDRRKFLATSILSTTTFFFHREERSAEARGLVQFPCTEPLSNTYHLLRAGESLLEMEDVWSTNPLFLTNRESALSERGREQMRITARQMKEMSASPSLVRYSLAAHVMDSADVLAQELKIGRDRLVPEFNFMDPRGIGQWDKLPLQSTEEAVWAMDVDEAGISGTEGRPPPNDDSTPNETLADQAVRLRQLISVLETQFSNDVILLLFPDGTGPALLSAMMVGIPFNRVHELEFKPAELRINVTMQSTLALLEDKQTNEYNDAIERGRTELRRLRDLKRQQAELEAQTKKEEEEALEAARRERMMQIQKEREERAAVQRGGGDGRNVALESAAAVVAGSAVIAAVVANDQTDEVLSGDPNDRSVETTNVTSIAENEYPIISPVDLTTIDPILQTNETKLDQSAEELGAPDVVNATQRINGDPKGMFEMSKPEAEAEKVMQEYLDSDDGGEAWLGMMSELMQEEEENEEDGTMGPDTEKRTEK